MCLAIPGKILSTVGEGIARAARVDFGGIVREVNLCYLPEAEIGNYVIVHVGFAIQRLDEESALETLSNFEKLGVLEEEFGDGFSLAAKQAGMEVPS